MSTFQRYRFSFFLYLLWFINAPSVFAQLIYQQPKNNNTQTELQDTDDTIPNCNDGDAYANLEECVYDCLTIHGKKDIAKTAIKDDSGKMRYKVVELENREFSMAPNGSLMTHLPIVEFHPNTFSHQQHDTAHVCYPLSERFITCGKWYLLTDEYEIINKSRSIWYKDTDHFYPLGEFYINRLRPENEAIVCKPSAASGITTPTFLSLIAIFVLF